MKTSLNDPLSDFFAWELHAKTPLSPDFCGTVLKKIAVNKRKERLFHIACISLTITCIIAVLLFVYPEYHAIFSFDWSRLFQPFLYVAHQVANSFKEVFGTLCKRPENLFMTALFAYLTVMAGALWSIDHFLRRRKFGSC